MSEEDGQDPIDIILALGTFFLVAFMMIGCAFYYLRREQKIEEEESKKKFEAECAALPIFPPPMVYQHQRKSRWMSELLCGLSLYLL